MLFINNTRGYRNTNFKHLKKILGGEIAYIKIRECLMMLMVGNYLA